MDEFIQSLEIPSNNYYSDEQYYKDIEERYLKLIENKNNEIKNEDM